MVQSLLLVSLVAVLQVAAQPNVMHSSSDPVQVVQEMEGALTSVRRLQVHVQIADSRLGALDGWLKLDRLDGRTFERIAGDALRRGQNSAAERRAASQEGMARLHRSRTMRVRAEMGDTLVIVYDGARSAALMPLRHEATVDTMGAGFVGKLVALSNVIFNFERPDAYSFNAMIESSRTFFDGTDTIGGVLCDVIHIEPFANLPQAIEASTRIITRVCVGRKDHLPRRLERIFSSPGLNYTIATTFRHLKVNPSLSEETFSTRVPEGYTVRYKSPPPPEPRR